LKKQLEIHLDELKSKGALRKLPQRSVAAENDFSSNDYLGFSRRAELIAGLSKVDRVGACSSRLISGSTPSHLQLEESFAEFFQSESCLTYGAGYLANIGVLSSLARRNDCVFSDKLIHASLHDGISLSKAKHSRFKHNDVEDLERLLLEASKTRSEGSRFIVVVESVYSMDGDLSPVREILALVEKYDCLLLVDEAHAFGVYGEYGQGLCSELGIVSEHLCLLGTFSKAFGVYGGVFIGPQVFKDYLINTSRSFIYNTALPLPIVNALQCSLGLLRSEPRLGVQVKKVAARFREILNNAGLDTMTSESHIVPVFIGDNQKCVDFSELLFERFAISALAIRPPTVAVGASRLRFSITANHSLEHIEEVARKVVEVAKEVKI